MKRKRVEKLWSEEDEDYVLKNHSKKTKKYMAIVLGKTEAQVHNKIMHLKRLDKIPSNYQQRFVEPTLNKNMINKHYPCGRYLITSQINKKKEVVVEGELIGQTDNFIIIKSKYITTFQKVDFEIGEYKLEPIN